MKNKWIELATFLLMAATVIAGFLTTTDVNMLPPEWRPYLPLVIGGIIMLKQLAYGVLDYLDDGLFNKSYKTPTSMLRALLLLPLCLFCSCQSMTPARTRALADVGLAVLESRGIVAPQDAHDIRLIANEVLPLQQPVTSSK